MTVFLSGGCKNGKSGIAEDICTRLAGVGPLYYIATMRAFDDEDRTRIRRHIAKRDGKGFLTLEQPNRILEILDRSDAAHSTYLLDSVTALMINELYCPCESSDPPTDCMTPDYAAAKRVASELAELCRKVKNIVFVSDYIYMEKDNYSEYTLAYLDALSHVDRVLAGVCDVVCEVQFGNTELYKGVLPV